MKGTARERKFHAPKHEIPGMDRYHRENITLYVAYRHIYIYITRFYNSDSDSTLYVFLSSDAYQAMSRLVGYYFVLTHYLC